MHTTAGSNYVLESCSFDSPFQFPNQHYDQPTLYQDIDRLIVKTPAVLLPAHRGQPDADGLFEIGIVRNNNTWLLDANGKCVYGTGDIACTFGKAFDEYVTGKWI